ncbi:hypothetical protein [Herbaspirillum frisingense]|uniref:hypothetical protein n=1 Tax=Herbaspirillum frisingense TaxID=92645 RepID=UPI0039B00CB2
MASEILAKSIVGDIVIEDVLCDVDGDLLGNETALSNLVQILRPAVNHVAVLCDDQIRLHEAIKVYSHLFLETSSVASAALVLFASNMIDAM